jgi:hypothetical protein
MARIKDMILTFEPSGSADVTGYKLYVQLAPDPVTYESMVFDLGMNTTIDIATLPGMTTLDGIYNIGVATVDKAGNDSSFSKLDDVPLDFVAPDPPGPLSFVSG